MTTYDNKMTFTLFRNNRKREGKNDADFTGTLIDKNGEEHWVSAWSKSPKNGGEKFLSASYRPKDAARAPAPQKRVELDDDVPFAAEFR